MTELFLDKERAVLGDNISIKVITENPYFTKSGNYTYNIPLPLNASENKMIFAHINRSDVSKRKMEFEAVLIADGRVLISGTATITEVTDETVSIQILGGNAEMNFYATASKKYIDELDLGTHIDSGYFYMSEEDCRKRYTPLYGDGDAVFLPIINSTDGQIYNYLKPVVHSGGDNWFFMIDRGTNYARLCIQPYLCAIVRKVIEALGYTIAENEMENSIFKNLLICNATATTKFAAALPHWTVSEFFTELENFLGLVILVYEGTRKVRILFAKNFYSREEPVYLSNVTDEFSCKIDEDSEQTVSDGNVGYDLDWDDVDYAQLSKEIVAAGTLKKYNSFIEMFTAMQNMSLVERSKVLFEQQNRQYIYFRTETGGSLREVNEWRHLIRNQDKEDVDVKLNIIPVKMEETEIMMYRYIRHANETTIQVEQIGFAKVAMPVMSGLAYSSEKEEEITLQDLLEGSTKTEKSSVTKMRVAFFGFYGNIAVGSTLHSYPVTWVDTHNPSMIIPKKYSLRFFDEDDVQCLGSVAHEGFAKINGIVEETKSVADKKKINPTQVMVINDKRYVCKQVEMTVTGKGIETVQKIVVYELVE